MTLARVVEPEWLDSLPANDPRAIRSRGDLRRINRIMGASAMLEAALDLLLRGLQAVELVEIGAGDGTLLLKPAQRRATDWPGVRLRLLDLQDVASDATLASYRALGWDAERIRADVFDWLDQSTLPEPSVSSADRPVVIANLFLHHFADTALCRLLNLIAVRARAVVFVEPRRSRFALAGSHLLGAIGCNDVTRHDAVVSVRAGFRDQELTERWPDAAAWSIDEGSAGLLSHRFVAQRRTPR